MIGLKEQVERALKAIMGMPLTDAGRALNMGMFSFGELRESVTHSLGKKGVVGEYALHIQCPWRVVGSEGIVVASGDRNYPEDENSDWQDFDSDGPSLCEARIDEWLQPHKELPLTVKSVTADRLGGFKMELSQGFILEVFPADSLRGEYSEHWRFFRPFEENHFVVTGHGIE